MFMKDQVLSIEQMQHLKKLGVDTSKAYFFYGKTNACFDFEIMMDYPCYKDRKFITDAVPAFTFLDMLEMMPNTIEVNESECNLCIFFHEDGVSIYYEDDYDEQPAFFCEDSILESAYNMLCWLAENGYLNKK